MLTRDEEAEVADLTAAVEALVDYAAANEHLADFVKQAWAIIEPSTPLLWNWHLDLMCEHLEIVARADCHALAINIPPRYAKSIIVTIMWPCWVWARDPARRFMFVSYSSSLSTDHSLSRRRIIESEWYRIGMGHWGHPRFCLTDDQNLKVSYENTYRGAMISTSVGGTAIGKGADFIVCDDILNPEEALSDASRTTANNFFDQTLSTRLNDKHTGAFVIVMQRLHTDDLTGHVLEQGGWTHVCIPGIAEEDTDVLFPSGRVVHREMGTLLWPEREDWAQLEVLRRRLSEYGFAGQYQQRLVPLCGGIIKRAYFRFWTRRRESGDGDEVLELPHYLTDHLQSWDTTYWASATSDYCVGQVWARHGAYRYLLDQVRGRMDLPATKAAIRALSAKWPQASAKLIERTANGAEVLRTMQGEIAGLIGVKVEGKKEARLMSVLSFLEAGNVVIPHPREAPWVPDFLFELTSFPSTPHDDQVDAMSQALERMRFSTAAVVPVVGKAYHFAARAAPGLGA